MRSMLLLAHGYRNVGRPTPGAPPRLKASDPAHLPWQLASPSSASLPEIGNAKNACLPALPDSNQWALTRNQRGTEVGPRQSVELRRSAEARACGPKILYSAPIAAQVLSAWTASQGVVHGGDDLGDDDRARAVRVGCSTRRAARYRPKGDVHHDDDFIDGDLAVIVAITQTAHGGSCWRWSRCRRSGRLRGRSAGRGVRRCRSGRR